jgi:predicted secreted protein
MDMFNDTRSKKIIFTAHCVLNQNSISDGTADHADAIPEIINLLQEHEIGIIQLPCPELFCLGLDRGDKLGSEQPVIVENSRIRKVMSEKDSVLKLNTIVSQTVYQIEEYLKYGFIVLGIIGINRSPSCGVETTSLNDKEVKGEGVFMELIRKELETRNISVKMIGIKTTEKEKAEEEIKDLLI